MPPGSRIQRAEGSLSNDKNSGAWRVDRCIGGYRIFGFLSSKLAGFLARPLYRKSGHMRGGDALELFLGSRRQAGKHYGIFADQDSFRLQIGV